MSRTNRLLEILISLQRRPRFTVQEMADEFGVSRRTMLRDLHALSEMGVPLQATPGPGGGYTLIARRGLLPLSLSADEAIGMVVAYEALLQYAALPFRSGELSAVTKLRNAMPVDVVRELDRIREHLVVGTFQPEYEAPLLGAVLTAAVERVHLDIVYESRWRQSERRIFPYGLVAAEGLWYCACFDHRRGADLLLRVDRMVSVEHVEGLEPLPPRSLRDWLKSYHSTDDPGLRFRARVTRQAARSYEFQALFGIVPVEEEEVVVERSIPASEIGYFAHRLLPLGTEVVVESPPEMIDLMCRRAQEVAELYAGNPP